MFKPSLFQMHSNILANYTGLTETLRCMEHARGASFGHQLRRVRMCSGLLNSVIAWCQRRICMLVRATKRTSQYRDCLSWYKDSHYKDEIEGLVQDCSNSIANALELLQSSTKPSRWLSNCLIFIMRIENPYSRKTPSLYWDGPLIQ